MGTVLEVHTHMEFVYALASLIRLPRIDKPMKLY